MFFSLSSSSRFKKETLVRCDLYFCFICLLFFSLPDFFDDCRSSEIGGGVSLLTTFIQRLALLADHRIGFSPIVRWSPLESDGLYTVCAKLNIYIAKWPINVWARVRIYVPYIMLTIINYYIIMIYNNIV